MRFALAYGAFLSVLAAGCGSVDSGSESEAGSLAEVAQAEPDPEPEVDAEVRRPSALERREAALERQRQEREAQHECEPEAGRDAEQSDLLTVESTASDLSNFGASGDQLTLTFSSCVSAGSVPLVRFSSARALDCQWDAECMVDGLEVVATVPLASTFRWDLADTTVIEVLNTTDVNGDPVRVPAPVPVTDYQRLSPLPELTQEIAQDALADVARRLAVAWRDGSDNYAELGEEVAEIAQSLLDGHAALEGDSSAHDWQQQVVWLSEIEVSGLAGDWIPTASFTAFTAIGIPGVPATIFAGVHEIGDEWAPDVAVPGTYVTFDVEGCYWERLDNTGSIIANNFIRAAPRVEVTITSSDFAFNSERCGRWTQIDF